MKRVVVKRPGGFSRLRIEDAPSPEPDEGEVCVTVRAIGVNYADVIIRMGLYESAWKYVGYPMTPGFEIAGTVSRVGEGVTTFREGDEVFGVTRFGGYATEIALPEEQLVKRPKTLSVEEAAAFPSVYLTAWYGLLDLAAPKPGAKILVHSAAGGVGTALLQLAKARQCFAVGVVGSSHKVDVAKAFGADVVIDKSTQKLWREAERAAPSGYDVVLDANGYETLKDSYAHLAPGGQLVIYGFHTMLPKKWGMPNPFELVRGALRTPRFNPILMTGANASVHAFNLSYMFDRMSLFREAMDELMGWLEDGTIKPLAVTTYPFEAVQEAHRALQSGSTVGKLVLQVEGSAR